MTTPGQAPSAPSDEPETVSNAPTRAGDGPIRKLMSFAENARPGMLALIGVLLGGFQVVFAAAGHIAAPALVGRSQSLGLAQNTDWTVSTDMFFSQPPPPTRSASDVVREFLLTVGGIAYGSITIMLYYATWVFILFAAARLLADGLDARKPAARPRS